MVARREGLSHGGTIMKSTDYEHLPNPRQLFSRMLLLIAASILLDTLLLALFVTTGAAPAWVPLAYAAVALGYCGTFYLLIASGWSERFRDSGLALAQLAVAALIQLVFMAAAPTVALYFVSLLFVVFGMASLRLRITEALVALLCISIALASVIVFVPTVLVIPSATALERALVGVCIVLTLARCTALGLYGSHLRVQLGRRHALIKASLVTSESRQVSVAEALHDDLGQELAGISLLLSACATRLKREHYTGVGEVADIAAQLRAAVEKARVLAVRAHPRWRATEERKAG
jgi:signal transduction histidine kinase